MCFYFRKKQMLHAALFCKSVCLITTCNVYMLWDLDPVYFTTTLVELIEHHFP